ncbi:MAG: D-tyrosyl-tRNA(Tyr) deacylase [Lachnospiraceae bacterium]|nr:D-tyrosyl-tRNA(Tyr) deacylase [Lachnospiraceae bacterium]
MRFVIQVCQKADVKIDNAVVGAIDRGLVVLVGVGQNDTEAIADRMVKKLLGLRIFADENGKTNLSVRDVGGSLLVISQFTLYADCRHGNRPGFTDAGAPDMANRLYEYILGKCGESGIPVAHGIFGADMKVSLVNDGPFTIILDSNQIC